VLAGTFPWYAARAGGIVAFALLTLTVLVGVILSGRARVAGWPRFAVEDVHGYLGLLTGAFIGIHLVALLADSYLPFSPTQLLVPGTSSYRPLATALGVVAAELLAAIALTNRFRKRLPYTFWRRAHYATFAVWLLALVHGVTAGTDRHSFWALTLYSFACAAVAGGIVWRAVRTRADAWSRRLWPSAAAIAAAEAVVVLAFVVR
jgi:methionine sulfoxide reductase heme-binding subunit